MIRAWRAVDRGRIARKVVDADGGWDKRSRYSHHSMGIFNWMRVVILPGDGIIRGVRRSVSGIICTLSSTNHWSSRLYALMHDRTDESGMTGRTSRA